MSSRGAVVAVASVVLLLAGCVSQPVPTVIDESSSPAPVEFAMPSACADLVAASRVNGLVLLGGPDGLYGDEYLAETTPEQDAGGITCIWGDDATEISSVTVSVAPLTNDTRELVVDNLLGQGLNVVMQNGYTEYAEAGDEEGSAAIYNAIRDDSWISVIETVGGEASFTEAVTIADDVAATVYR